jgi:hypothetical protein
MSLPKGSAEDFKDITFIYEKNGIKKEFKGTELELINDTSWKYVDRVEKEPKEEVKPPIHDFTVSTIDGNDITDSILSNPGISCIIISNDLEEANPTGLNKVKTFTDALRKKNISIYGLTASTTKTMEDFEKKYHFNFNFHITDKTQLKTIIRANPGIMLIQKGTIVGKWHYNNLPEVKDTDADVLSVALRSQQIWKDSWVIIASVLFLFFLVFSLLLLIRFDN